MFVNYQHHTHVQSFFSRFSSEHIVQADFRKFWHDYYPSEERAHTINKGEIKLSKTLTNLGHTPYAYVSADRVLSGSLFGDFNENERRNIRRLAGMNSATPITLGRQEIEALMRAQFTTLNITHSLGTLTSRVLGAPLKLDLNLRFVSQEAMHDALLALGSTREESDAVLTFMLTSKVRRRRPTLHDLMTVLHRTLAPRTYIEVGVFRGASLKLARCPAVGIDPAPQVARRLPATTQVIATTGDDFFAQPRPLERVFSREGVPASALVRRPQLLKHWLQGVPRRSDGERFAELALIDGMHHAEFALRDFMNVERNSAPWSVIVFDDTLPENHEQALRARATEAWTGDVFRVEQILKKYRPDLVTVRVDIYTGALLVFAPNHLDQRLTNSYDQIVAEYVHPDPQVVPDEVLQRDGVISIEALTSSGVLQVVRTAREQKASSEWVAREVRARLAG
jgi:hypothetical protein